MYVCIRRNVLSYNSAREPGSRAARRPGRRPSRPAGSPVEWAGKQAGRGRQAPKGFLGAPIYGLMLLFSHI